VRVRIFGCKKFARLSSEQSDRQLTTSETRFLNRHRAVCLDCQEVESTTNCALNMLRMATLEAEVEPMFEDRVLRRLHVQQVRESLNYWSPALVGAGIACAVIFVTLQLASSAGSTARANLPAGQARLEISSRMSPKLELDRPPVLR